MELRQTGNDRAELYVRSMNSSTVIPRCATLDRAALSDFLCLSVSAEEDGAMHYMQSLRPADGSLSARGSSGVGSSVLPLSGQPCP